MLPWNKLNVLVSVPYLEDELLEAIGSLGSDCRFMLDCGAFTALNAGTVLSLDSYCTLVEKLRVRPWKYMTLDVVGDHETTRKNYVEMKRRGFDPIPVYQRGAPQRDLDFYFEQASLVAMGGINGAGPKLPYVKWLCETLRQRPAHLLGFTNVEWLKAYKPFSCDSSNWEVAARYGAVHLYAGRGRFQVVRRDHFKKKPPPALLDRIAALGFDPYQLQRDESWRRPYAFTTRISARSWLLAARDIENACGTLLFLACISRSAKDFLVPDFKLMASGALKL